MGCGQPPRRRPDCTSVAANSWGGRPAFRTPSVGLRPTPSPLRCAEKEGARLPIGNEAPSRIPAIALAEGRHAAILCGTGACLGGPGAGAAPLIQEVSPMSDYD